MLGEPGSDQDVKPHYALHCLANHTVIAKDENGRRALCEVLARSLSGDHTPYVKGFLCQKLQWVGHRESAAALGKLLTDEELCDAGRDGLGGHQGRRGRAVAVGAAQGQGPLPADHRAQPGRAGATRAPPRRSSRRCRTTTARSASPPARAWPSWATPAPSTCCSRPPTCEPGWERIQATKHCLVLAEKLTAAGKKAEARRIYQHLRDTRKDASEAYIRQAADKALATV